VRRVLVLRLSGLAGISAATLYAGTTAFGSVVDATYSQVAQSVSEPTAADVSHRSPFVAMYVASALLLAVFAIGLRMALGDGRLSTIGVVLVLLNVGAGLAMVMAFPMDQSHAHGHTTTATAVHNVFAGAAALFGMAGTNLTRVGRTASPVLALTSTGARAEERSCHIREVNTA
jgi:hypothetical protein